MDIIVKDVLVSRQEWIERTHLTDELAGAVMNADVLIVPSNYVDRPLAFPVTTMDFFALLKQHMGDKVEICVNEDDYEEIELNSHTLRLPNLKVAGGAMLTIALNLISTYIYNKIDDSSQTPVTVNVEVTVPEYQKPTEMDFVIEVEDSIAGKSKAFHYKGSAADFKDASEEIIRMWDEEKGK